MNNDKTGISVVSVGHASLPRLGEDHNESVLGPAFTDIVCIILV